MKKTIFLFVVLASLAGPVFSQDEGEWKWGGTVRFKPAATLIGLGRGYLEIMAAWVPYVAPNVGIPIEVELASIGGVTGVGVLTGIEAVPVGSREKNGLYLTALGGAIFIEKHVVFAAKGDIGYQLVTNGGFVFTPAAGVKFNSVSGLSLDLMLDIGFAYRKR